MAVGDWAVVVVSVVVLSQSYSFASKTKVFTLANLLAIMSRSFLVRGGGGSGGGAAPCCICFLLCRWLMGMDEASALVHALWLSLVCCVL